MQNLIITLEGWKKILKDNGVSYFISTAENFIFVNLKKRGEILCSQNRESRDYQEPERIGSGFGIIIKSSRADGRSESVKNGNSDLFGRP